MKNPKPTNQLKKECEYKLPNCQKTADTQIIFQLGSVNIAKYWACDNCKIIVERERKLQRLASETKRNSKQK